jgi:hypothetical protein
MDYSSNEAKFERLNSYLSFNKFSEIIKFILIIDF